MIVVVFNLRLMVIVFSNLMLILVSLDISIVIIEVWLVSLKLFELFCFFCLVCFLFSIWLIDLVSSMFRLNWLNSLCVIGYGDSLLVFNVFWCGWIFLLMNWWMVLCIIRLVLDYLNIVCFFWLCGLMFGLLVCGDYGGVV